VTVPYFRLDVTDAECAAVEAVLRSGWLTTGKQAQAFETEFARQIGGDVSAIAVNSNTSGMHLVLEALGVGPGDEVIVPSLTFTATAEVARYLGASVKLVDVDEITLNIDVAKVEEAITSRTKVIMVVHYAGLAADMQKLCAIAQSHGIGIVEDAAHSFPATSNGRPIGQSGGRAAIFSFYANKTITTGEGGMIVTRDHDLAKRCRIMRLHGIDRDAFQRFTGNSSQWQYDVVAPGFKYNLTDIAAAFGREQLKFAETHRARRQHIAEFYRAAFSDLPLILPAHGDRMNVHAWHIYPVRIDRSSGLSRQALEHALQSSNIGYSMHYTPLHRLTYWKEICQVQDDMFPVSSLHGDTTLSLPIFSVMKDEEMEEVVHVVRSFCQTNSR
jgi:dTDP-4-amino-4,6-dideoxygalactose transaminase